MLQGIDIGWDLSCACETLGASHRGQAGSAVLSWPPPGELSFLQLWSWRREKGSMWKPSAILASTEPRGSGSSAGHSYPLPACWTSTWDPLWCPSPGRMRRHSTQTLSMSFSFSLPPNHNHHNSIIKIDRVTNIRVTNRFRLNSP